MVHRGHAREIKTLCAAVSLTVPHGFLIRVFFGDKLIFQAYSLLAGRARKASFSNTHSVLGSRTALCKDKVNWKVMGSVSKCCFSSLVKIQAASVERKLHPLAIFCMFFTQHLGTIMLIICNKIKHASIFFLCVQKKCLSDLLKSFMTSHSIKGRSRDRSRSLALDKHEMHREKETHRLRTPPHPTRPSLAEISQLLLAVLWILS